MNKLSVLLIIGFSLNQSCDYYEWHPQQANDGGNSDGSTIVSHSIDLNILNANGRTLDSNSSAVCPEILKLNEDTFAINRICVDTKVVTELNCRYTYNVEIPEAQSPNNKVELIISQVYNLINQGKDTKCDFKQERVDIQIDDCLMPSVCSMVSVVGSSSSEEKRSLVLQNKKNFKLIFNLQSRCSSLNTGGCLLGGWKLTGLNYTVKQ